MAFKLNDRVKESSSTTGTGTFTLGGAVTGFETFAAGIGNSNTTYYAIVNRDADEWEVGLGTVTDASTDTLARTTVNPMTTVCIVPYLTAIVPDAEQAAIPPSAALAPGSIGKKTPLSFKSSFSCSLVTLA